mmetsp:Transcript_5090/g.21635  ORF Transcript_5090/g.21635 Transcript_5090/m.21635 type:complete len:208 (+) Transcript_5090:1353-1976(+)
MRFRVRGGTGTRRVGLYGTLRKQKPIGRVALARVGGFARAFAAPVRGLGRLERGRRAALAQGRFSLRRRDRRRRRRRDRRRGRRYVLFVPERPVVDVHERPGAGPRGVGARQRRIQHFSGEGSPGAQRRGAPPLFRRHSRRRRLRHRRHQTRRRLARWTSLGLGLGGGARTPIARLCLQQSVPGQRQHLSRVLLVQPPSLQRGGAYP